MHIAIWQHSLHVRSLSSPVGVDIGIQMETKVLFHPTFEIKSCLLCWYISMRQLLMNRLVVRQLVLNRGLPSISSWFGSATVKCLQHALIRSVPWDSREAKAQLCFRSMVRKRVRHLFVWKEKRLWVLFDLHVVTAATLYLERQQFPELGSSRSQTWLFEIFFSKRQDFQQNGSISAILGL